MHVVAVLLSLTAIFARLFPPKTSDDVPKSEDPLQIDGLKAAIEFTGLSTTLATGTLVFSLGLLEKIAGFPDWGRVALGAAWFLLVVSIVSGLLARATLPPKLFEHDLDIIHDTSLTRPAVIHLFAFIGAVVVLGAALFSELLEPSLKVATATEAVAQAQASLLPGQRAVKLSELKLVAAADAGGSPTWQVQFELAAPVGSHADVLVRARDGLSRRID